MAELNQTKEWNQLSEKAFSQNFPLHCACRDGDIALLSNFLQHQDSATVHLSLEDKYFGWTPLHWACYFGKTDCLRVLLAAPPIGPDIKTSLYIQTPTHIAAFAGYSQCLQMLIQAGSDINCQDYLGETPLHKASRSGSKDCVTLLINSKADCCIKNKYEKTAAELAQMCHQTEVVDLFSLRTEESSSCPLLSSNGYYGYQPLNASGNLAAAELETDTEMDTEDTASQVDPNIQSKGHINDHMNGFFWLSGTANGINDHGRTNNSPKFGKGSLNGENEDITINEEFSQNRVSVAGKKRSREEFASTPVMKRIRTEDILGESVDITPGILGFSPRSAHDSIHAGHDPAKGANVELPISSLLCSTKIRQQQEMIWVV